MCGSVMIYAAAHGWEVAAVFREIDTSAFKQRTITLPSGERVRRVIRPQFRAMLKHLADDGSRPRSGLANSTTHPNATPTAPSQAATGQRAA